MQSTEITVQVQETTWDKNKKRESKRKHDLNIPAYGMQTKCSSGNTRLLVIQSKTRRRAKKTAYKPINQDERFNHFAFYKRNSFVIETSGVAERLSSFNIKIRGKSNLCNVQEFWFEHRVLRVAYLKKGCRVFCSAECCSAQINMTQSLWSFSNPPQSSYAQSGNKPLGIFICCIFVKGFKLDED